MPADGREFTGVGLWSTQRLAGAGQRHLGRTNHSWESPTCSWGSGLLEPPARWTHSVLRLEGRSMGEPLKRSPTGGLQVATIEAGWATKPGPMLRQSGEPSGEEGGSTLPSIGRSSLFLGPPSSRSVTTL